MNIKTIISDAEQDIEAIIAHVRAMLEKNPKHEIHINPTPPTTITVGGPHPASATPTGHKKP